MSQADDRDLLPLFAEGTAWADARSALEALDLADGLPMAPPTAALMAEMLAGVADPDRGHGMAPPLFGEITARSVAYNCVLADCPPGALPVVLTAATACLADDFNLLGLLTTTGSPAVALVVHGAIARRLGMNDGISCLGPGNRANAAIGRALALVLRNVAGARPGIGDMATVGQPGKYGFCFAESASGHLPTLPARQGLPADADAVTVLGVSGTVEVLPLDDRDSGEAILAPVAAAAIAVGAVASAGRARPAGDQVFLLPPELAAGLEKHGWGLDRIRDYIFAQRRVDMPGVAAIEAAQAIAETPAAIQPVVAGGPGIKMCYLPLWMGGSRIQTRPLLDLKA